MGIINISSSSDLENQGAIPARPQKVNTKLLPYKCFYFLLYSSIGSLVPYLAIFYKELLLPSQEIGILIGIAPFVQFVGCLVMGVIADYSGKPKYLFLLSLAAGMISNFSLSLVGSVHLDLCRDNQTFAMGKRDFEHFYGKVTNRNISTASTRSFINNITKNISYSPGEFSRRVPVSLEAKFVVNKSYNMFPQKMSNAVEKKERKIDELYALGHSPWLFADSNYEGVKQNGKNGGLFYQLLVLTIVGGFIAAPVVPLADTATLQNLGDSVDDYGKQRQWGSLGYGVSSFMISAVTNTVQEASNCNVPSHLNYTPCFYVFAVLMSLAFIPAFFFNFENASVSTRTNMREVIKSWHHSECIIYLVAMFSCGCSSGLLEMYLPWHLQNLGGTQFLFSLIALVHCLSECVIFCLAGHLIRTFGHYNLLCISLTFTWLRLTLYGVIKNAWLVLPIEVFHGLSTSLLWSLAVSYTITRTASVLVTVQAFLYGFLEYFSFGCGAIICGILVRCVGLSKAFPAFGFILLSNLCVVFISRKLL